MPLIAPTYLFVSHFPQWLDKSIFWPTKIWLDWPHSSRNHMWKSSSKGGFPVKYINAPHKMALCILAMHLPTIEISLVDLNTFDCSLILALLAISFVISGCRKAFKAFDIEAYPTLSTYSPCFHRLLDLFKGSLFIGSYFILQWDISKFATFMFVNS